MAGVVESWKAHPSSAHDQDQAMWGEVKQHLIAKPSVPFTKDGVNDGVEIKQVGGRVEHTAAEGNGPVNALDAALRAALEPSCPWLADVALSDYKVRILDQGHGTDAITRVLIETSDGSGRAPAPRSWIWKR